MRKTTLIALVAVSMPFVSFIVWILSTSIADSFEDSVSLFLKSQVLAALLLSIVATIASGMSIRKEGKDRTFVISLFMVSLLMTLYYLFGSL